MKYHVRNLNYSLQAARGCNFRAMDNKYVFISEPLPLSSLHCRRLIWSASGQSATADTSAFTQTVLRARELIFTFPEVLANPLADQRAVMVAAPPQFFLDPRFHAKCEKLSLSGVGQEPSGINRFLYGKIVPVRGRYLRVHIVYLGSRGRSFSRKLGGLHRV